MSQVLILMGSDSDAPIMSAAGEVLTELGVTWEMTVASAHRSPARVMRLMHDAPGKGVRVPLPSKDRYSSVKLVLPEAPILKRSAPATISDPPSRVKTGLPQA